ncbi:MAG: oxygen-dependent protoporphyrinogen oxidase [Motiliproteus sp.]|jgi:oxygen-dependent protoporphyrinogen oxidase
MSRSYLILGAGISGLTTAWFLKQQGHQVTLLETRDQAGGKLCTLKRDGFLIERGPNSTLNNRPALDILFESLALTPIQANSASHKRFILRDQQIHPLPMSPGAFIRTPLFKAAGKWRLLLEPFIGRAREEESVAQFVERRLGKEFLDYAINPFVSGVYAGDPDKLSARAATAKVYALERDYRSMIVGAIAKTLFHKHRGGAGPSGDMISFADGMQYLAATLAEKLGAELHTGIQVDQLRRHDNGQWQAGNATRQWQADEVILTLPANACADLLSPHVAELKGLLEPIEYPTVASVSLGFKKSRVSHPLDGFGFLIPRCTGVETLGVLFPSSVFPGRAPEDHHLLTCFIGGSLNPEAATVDDAQLLQRVLRDIKPVLGIEGAPELVEISRWPQAIPQYQLGHLQRLEAIDKALKPLPGLHIRANWRDGISVADCIQNGYELAQELSE